MSYQIKNQTIPKEKREDYNKRILKAIDKNKGEIPGKRSSTAIPASEVCTASNKPISEIITTILKPRKNSRWGSSSRLTTFAARLSK